MKIKIQGDYLLIEPETDFESDYLQRYQIIGVDGFLKTGVDLTQVIGLKIYPKKPDKDCSAWHKMNQDKDDFCKFCNKPLNSDF